MLVTYKNIRKLLKCAQLQNKCPINSLSLQNAIIYLCKTGKLVQFSYDSNILLVTAVTQCDMTCISKWDVMTDDVNETIRYEIILNTA